MTQIHLNTICLQLVFILDIHDLLFLFVIHKWKSYFDFIGISNLDVQIGSRSIKNIYCFILGGKCRNPHDTVYNHQYTNIQKSANWGQKIHHSPSVKGE